MTYEEFKAQLPALVQNYQPSDKSIARLKNVSLLIVVGPSGVGKTTIINQLGIAYVPSDTTRPPRPGETNGLDMNFFEDYMAAVSDIEQGHFAQIAVGASGDLYATRATSYPASGWATMPVMADVVPVFRRLGFQQTKSIFITPPSYEEWMRRLETANFTDEQKQKRLAEGRRSLEFALADPEVSLILNDKVEDAVSQIKNLLSGKIDAKRELQARQAAEELLHRII